jgi:hypothetical protein
MLQSSLNNFVEEKRKNKHYDNNSFLQKLLQKPNYKNKGIDNDLILGVMILEFRSDITDYPARRLTGLYPVSYP